ncbi:type II CAAX endopeptidase family protein [Aeromicrobium sp. NPDC092404]|uniref:CPBP family intramembrane glutamic endopeptidase n=1 Tax=Aeromicrobium sp. NPDC092404 TaxID=3154976 RepID=UPI00342B42EA
MSTRYHRLARETPAYAWWRLPVAGLLTVVLWIGAGIVLVVVAVIAFATGSGLDQFEAWADGAGELDLQHLDFFALDMLSIIIAMPAVLVAVLITGPRPIGYLSSVAGRLRWKWLALTGVVAFAVFIATIGGAVALGEATDPTEISPAEISTRALVAIGLILLLVPFQAAAEEYVFRGYILQLVGSWSRFAFIPVVVSVPLFVAGHAYELWGLVDVGIFGLMAAVVTIRTGGLEAAIAAHTANNVVLFVLDALGMFSATDDSDAGPLDLVPTVVSSVVFLVLVELLARRKNLQRTRPPIAPPPPPQAPMWPPVPYAYWWPPVTQAPPQQWHPAPAPPSSHLAGPPPSASAAPAVPGPDYPGELPPDWDSGRR